MPEQNIVEIPIGDNNFNLYELRKRRGSYPLLNKSEILSSEILAPLPQGNVSKTVSREFHDDDERKPLLKVNHIK